MLVSRFILSLIPAVNDPPPICARFYFTLLLFIFSILIHAAVCYDESHWHCQYVMGFLEHLLRQLFDVDFCGVVSLSFLHRWKHKDK